MFYVNTIKEGRVLKVSFQLVCLANLKIKIRAQLSLTIASMRLLVQQTRMLVKLRILSSAVRS